ncbi:MAG: hypothetical protein ACYDHD_12335 [Vulcanimicrobiaceae bacterium]
MNDFVVLIDGSGRYRAIVEDSTDLGLAPGPHMFVLHEEAWFECVVISRPRCMYVVFCYVVDNQLAQNLTHIWCTAHKATKSDEDIDALGLVLTLDAIRVGARAYRATREWNVDQGERQRGEIASSSSLGKIDDVLGQAKADLEFVEHLLEHGAHFHCALHLITLGDPLGILSLLSLIFSAMGHTFVQDHDVESLAIDVLKDVGPKPVRITAQLFDGTETVLDIRDLANQDVSLWQLLGQWALQLDAERELEAPSFEYEQERDLGLSL